MAVDDRKVGVFMFLPAAAYIGLLIGAPLLLAVLYAFSDARIGTLGFHFVGLENFRSILQSPSFRAALRNSVVFTVFAQIIVIVASSILSIALEPAFHGRWFVRLLILLRRFRSARSDGSGFSIRFTA